MRGKKAEEVNRPRKEQVKVDLDRKAFASDLAEHLHTASFDATRSAADEVTNHRAQLKAELEAVQEQIAALEAEQAHLDALGEATIAILSETQAQSQVQTERTATRQDESHSLGMEAAEEQLRWSIQLRYDEGEVSAAASPQSSASNGALLLDFSSCSPVPHRRPEPLVVHEVELAMQVVNRCVGREQADRAIAELLQRLNSFLSQKATAHPFKEKHLIATFTRLATHFQQRPVPLAYLRQGVSTIIQQLDELGGWMASQPRTADLTQAWQSLLRAVGEVAGSVEKLSRQCAEQSAVVDRIYAEARSALLMKLGLLRFFDSDCLARRVCRLHLLNQSPGASKLRDWLQRRLRGEALHLALVHSPTPWLSTAPPEEQRQWLACLSTARRRLTALAERWLGQLESIRKQHHGQHIRQPLSRDLRQYLRSERSGVLEKKSRLRRNRQWMAEHLVELCQLSIFPRPLKPHRLFSDCIDAWASDTQQRAVFDDDVKDAVPEPPVHDDEAQDGLFMGCKEVIDPFLSKAAACLASADSRGAGHVGAMPNSAVPGGGPEVGYYTQAEHSPSGVPSVRSSPAPTRLPTCRSTGQLERGRPWSSVLRLSPDPR